MSTPIAVCCGDDLAVAASINQVADEFPTGTIRDHPTARHDRHGKTRTPSA
jgi:hypothetical protein